MRRGHFTMCLLETYCFEEIEITSFREARICSRTIFSARIVCVREAAPTSGACVLLSERWLSGLRLRMASESFAFAKRSLCFRPQQEEFSFGNKVVNYTSGICENSMSFYRQIHGRRPPSFSAVVFEPACGGFMKSYLIRVKPLLTCAGRRGRQV